MTFCYQTTLKSRTFMQLLRKLYYFHCYIIVAITVSDQQFDKKVFNLINTDNAIKLLKY